MRISSLLFTTEYIVPSALSAYRTLIDTFSMNESINEWINANKSCFAVLFSKMTSRMKFQKEVLPVFFPCHYITGVIQRLVCFLLCLTLEGMPVVGISTAVCKRTKAEFWQVFIYSTWKILLGLIEKVLALLSVALSLTIASDMHKGESFCLCELPFSNGFNKDGMSYCMCKCFAKD